MVGLQKERIRRSKRKKILMFTAIVIVSVAALLLFLKYRYIRVETESFPFTESAHKLSNPNRGFYHLYTYLITEEQTDYEEVIQNIDQNDTDTELMMIKICLQRYREGRISENGIKNIKRLFAALESLDKQMILRFVYDDEGKGEEHEPESLDIILRHMEQLKPILHEHSRQIFVLQGLFTGDWGEMNGTRYDEAEDMLRLAGQLKDTTDASVYLAVRTPAQWRSIIQSNDPAKEITSGNPLASRLSLFNDGLLGNRSDYGTYKTEDGDGIDPLGRWNREEELDFQKELCRYVPNGGEVINDNSYNDFERAAEGLAERHITYLNKDYDQAVLKKWKNDTVTEVGCFYGLDGYTYIDRHLGYRLLIADTYLEYRQRQRSLLVEVALKNVGFAPLYKETKINLILYREDEEKLLSKEMTCDLSGLSGGEEAEECQTAYAEIPVSELSQSEYTVYFSIEDLDTGKHILLANEQDVEEYGYRIGTVQVY